MTRTLVIGAVIVAAFYFGFEWGYERGESNPRPSPVCNFQGYYIPTRIFATAPMLARLGGETELCIRYEGVFACDEIEPTVEEAFRHAGMRP